MLKRRTSSHGSTGILFPNCSDLPWEKIEKFDAEGWTFAIFFEITRTMNAGGFSDQIYVIENF